MRLSERQLEQALQMFAEGYSRTSIVSHFMEKDDILWEQAAADENRHVKSALQSVSSFVQLICQVLGLLVRNIRNFLICIFKRRWIRLETIMRRLLIAARH